MYIVKTLYRDDPSVGYRLKHRKLNQQKAVKMAQVMRAVAHPTRLRILARLCQAESTVNQITESLGVLQAIVSQQLKILRTRGLVKVKRRGLYAHYSIAKPELRSLLCCVEKCGTPGVRKRGAN